MKKPTLSLVLGILLFGFVQPAELYKVKSGKVRFVSDAPEEIIKAETEGIIGLLNTAKKTFAFSVPVSTFMGFNSELQREHFNENYMESTKYPKAIFTGKVTSDVDFSKPGTHNIQATGKFKVHGIPKEKTIDIELVIEGLKITANSSFTILLSDHDIEIPSVVKKKLSNAIRVDVQAVLEPK